jgi:hypothetical protein
MHEEIGKIRTSIAERESRSSPTLGCNEWKEMRHANEERSM